MKLLVFLPFYFALASSSEVNQNQLAAAELLGTHFGAVVNNYCACTRFPLPRCGCCYDYKLMKESHLVCTIFAHLKDVKGLRFSVVLDGQVVVTKTLSEISPPAFCQGPKPYAYVCEKYSNMSYGDNNKWGGCLEIYGGVSIKIFDTQCGCLYLPVSKEVTQITDENLATPSLADRFKNSLQGSQRKIQDPYNYKDIFGKKQTKLRQSKKSGITWHKIIFKSRVEIGEGIEIPVIN